MNLAPRLIALLVLGLCSSLSAGDFDVTCYYVSPNGSSGNPGTEAQPWSLSKANFSLIAGDTAILMDGVYPVGISPANSGTAEHPITFRAQHSRQVSISNVSPAIEVSDRSYIVIEGIKVEDAGSSHWIQGNQSHHITVKDCYFRNSTSWESCRFLNTGGYITVIECHFEDGQDSLHIRGGRGHYIAGNTFIKDSHANLVIMGVSKSVVENNVLRNEGQKCMEVFSMRGVFDPPIKSEYNLIQKNYFHSGDRSGIQCAGNRTIIRNNVFDGGTAGMRWVIQSGLIAEQPEAWWCEENRFYNNTIFGCKEAIQTKVSKAVLNKYGGAFGENVHINNIISCGTNSLPVRIDFTPTRMSFFFNNIITNGSSNNMLRKYQVRYPGQFGDNIEVSPQFVDPESGDFRLLAQSQCIDAGGPLTYTKGGGSGKRVRVADALFFTDGHGLIAPDVVRIGDNVCTIVEVDYDQGIITIEEPITWTDGSGVGMNFFGSGPDIGAFEFIGGGDKIIMTDEVGKKD